MCLRTALRNVNDSLQLAAAHARAKFVIEVPATLFTRFDNVRLNDTAWICLYCRLSFRRVREGGGAENHEDDRNDFCHGKSPDSE